MRSRASVKGHPLHPILIAFPIAFTVGALVLDFSGHFAHLGSAATAGAYLSVGAVVSGLIAGVPGIVDYFAVVPPNSSAKARATRHMVVNLTALAIFALGWLDRDLDTLTPGVWTLVAELAGVALIGWGGSMGGTLVYRNQIAVDHRQANAGKWRERRVDPGDGKSAVVAKADELEPGQMMLLHVGKKRIVLARTDSGFAAFDDRCTHRGGSLADGVLACGVVTCPWHGSQFEAKTGEVKSGPADKPIGAYQVTRSGDEVRLTLPGRE